MSSKVENTQADLFNENYSFKTGVCTEVVSKRSDSSNERDGVYPTRLEFIKEIFKGRLGVYKKDPKAFGGLEPKIKDIGFSLQSAPGIRQSKIPTPNRDNFSVLIRLFNHLNKLNGKSFKDEIGVTHTVKDASCSCWDRTAPDDAVPGARVVETEGKDSIFYGGRPDLEKRAEILGEEIFKNEMASEHKKGIKEVGDRTYELHYLVGSLTNTLPGLSEWRNYVPGAGQALDERDSLELEVKTLNKLRNSSTPIEIAIDGITYKVLLKPMHIHCMVSCFSFYKFFKNGGQDLENKINQKGYQQLINYYEKMDMKVVPPQHQAWAKEIITTLNSEKESTAIAPHLRLAMVDMLAQICRLPVVLHCKSVVDRTSGAGAVSIANRMVLDGKMEIGPANMKFAEIIKQDQYKQNFLMALQAQLSTSSDLRSAVNLDGRINTDRVLPGYEWHEGVDTVAFTFAEFIPKEGLKLITTMQKVKNFAKQLFVFTLTLLAYCLGIGSKLKLPIVRPTWLKPTHTFDHESKVLSEDGTRPLLVGPHHRRMKHKIKQAEKSGKLDISTLNVLRQKAILQGIGFSEQEIDRLKLLQPGVKVTCSFDLDDFYQSCQGYSPQLAADLYRNNHTLNGERYELGKNERQDSTRKKPISDFANTPSDERQKKYYDQILTQTAMSIVITEIGKRYQMSPRKAPETPIEFIISEGDKTVTASFNLDLMSTSEDHSISGVKASLEVKVVFPFDHTKGAEFEWTVVAPNVDSSQENPTNQAVVSEPDEKPSLSLLQDFATRTRKFLERFIPSFGKLK